MAAISPGYRRLFPIQHGSDVLWRVLGVAFGFAIAVNVIAAIASALTGKRKQLTAAPESLGDELAAASASGGFEPAELVTQDEREDSQASGP